MTIGIVASGLHAGEAVRKAVITAELLGRGAIGGFTVFACMDGNGDVYHVWGQTGGVTALHIPPDWLCASKAAVISSGPNRPEPLVQFLPGRDGLGLVSGHRLPNRPSSDTSHPTPLNQRVLHLLADKATPQQAVDQVLLANPEADAGLLALSADGRIGFGNTQRVSRRTDLGQGLLVGDATAFAFLHNSIYASDDLPAALSSVLASALAQKTGLQPQPLYEILHLTASVHMVASDTDAVHVDAQWGIVRVDTADPFLRTARQQITLLYLGTPVLQHGLVVGHLASEVFSQVDAGAIALSPIAIDNLALMRACDVSP